jgi:hypothetical protein
MNDSKDQEASPKISSGNHRRPAKIFALWTGVDTRLWCLDIFAAEPMLSQTSRRGFAAQRLNKLAQVL